MSVWQIMVALVFLFAIAFCLSFRRKKTAFRTTMRVLAIGIPISAPFAFGLLRPDCHFDINGFYENKGTLCYKYTDFLTLTRNGNGESIPIMKFSILDQDRAIVYPRGEDAHIILAIDGEFKIYSYDIYKTVINLEKRYGPGTGAGSQ
ncbi:hypothetical protein [Photorhabdus tasmaniensis]|nr:hypothetical protein [Photorhabdus tasmaniensis]